MQLFTYKIRFKMLVPNYFYAPNTIGRKSTGLSDNTGPPDNTARHKKTFPRT